MLVSLTISPSSPKEWDDWSFSHRNSHDKIRTAIQTKNATAKLSDFVIDPINPSAHLEFLESNQTLHDEMNASLGVLSGDLKGVDLNDDKQREAWIQSHYLEHQTAEEALQV